jgi:hypothetical protein
MHEAAHITPLLKKSSLDATDVKSYEPAFNFSVLSKFLEHLVAKQLIDCLKSAKFFPLHQSAYWLKYWTETAILRDLTEIFTVKDHGDLSALVLMIYRPILIGRP